MARPMEGTETTPSYLEHGLPGCLDYTADFRQTFHNYLVDDTALAKTKLVTVTVRFEHHSMP